MRDRSRPPRPGVVVGVDGSPNSIAALRSAAGEARRRRVALDVVHVLPPDRGQRPLRTAVEWVRLRRLATDVIPRAGRVAVRARILYGDPGALLPRAAARADLLIIGARPLAGGNPFGGRTVPAVWDGATCELEICADHALSARGIG